MCTALLDEGSPAGSRSAKTTLREFDFGCGMIIAPLSVTSPPQKMASLFMTSLFPVIITAYLIESID